MSGHGPYVTGAPDGAGYAYRLLLVAVPDDDHVHFVPVVADLVWMRRLADIGLAVPFGEPWPHARIFETQTDRTICGAETLGPGEPADRHDEFCARCMALVDGCFDDGVERLAARWVEHWPDLPRDLALAEHRARRA